VFEGRVLNNKSVIIIFMQVLCATKECIRRQVEDLVLFHILILDEHVFEVFVEVIILDQ
jgi:hypothetical protein